MEGLAHLVLLTMKANLSALENILVFSSDVEDVRTVWFSSLTPGLF